MISFAVVFSNRTSSHRSPAKAPSAPCFLNCEGWLRSTAQRFRSDRLPRHSKGSRSSLSVRGWSATSKWKARSRGCRLGPTICSRSTSPWAYEARWGATKSTRSNEACICCTPSRPSTMRSRPFVAPSSSAMSCERFRLSRRSTTRSASDTSTRSRSRGSPRRSWKGSASALQRAWAGSHRARRSATSSCSRSSKGRGGRERTSSTFATTICCDSIAGRRRAFPTRLPPWSRSTGSMDECACSFITGRVPRPPASLAALPRGTSGSPMRFARTSAAKRHFIHTPFTPRSCTCPTPAVQPTCCCGRCYVRTKSRFAVAPAWPPKG